MFNKMTRDLLKKLIDAEKSGKPLTTTDLASEMRGFTFEDAWANGYINQNPDRSVVASPAGKQWYDSNRGSKRGTF